LRKQEQQTRNGRREEQGAQIEPERERGKRKEGEGLCAIKMNAG
jgi:hypothetical protein